MKLAAYILLIVILIAGCGETVVQQETPVRTSSIPGSNPYESVIVTGSVVNLRQGPGTQYAIVGSAVSGDLLLVTGEAPDWYRVYIPEKSLFAWIYSELTTGAQMPR